MSESLLNKSIRKAIQEKSNLSEQDVSEAWYDIGSLLSDYSDYFPLDTELGKVEIEESREGGEDMGISDVHFVLKVTGGVSYYRVTGTYDSWEGSQWENDMIPVEPTEKTITVFEPVGGK